jgi:hypothetical protein
MCIVCVELIKHKMTLLEAERNLGELGRVEKDREKAEHYQNLHDAIKDMDVEEIGWLLEEG